MLKSEILISQFPCEDRTLVGIGKMEGIRTPMKPYLYLFNGCLRVFFEKAIFSIFCWETKNGEQSISMDLKHFVSLFWFRMEYYFYYQAVSITQVFISTLSVQI